MKSALRVLVTGATGFTGRYVAEELLNAGHTVAAFVRDPVKAAELGGECPGVELREGCFEEPRSLRAAMDGCDALVNVASIGFGHAADIVRAAEEAGVKRAVFFSTTAIFTTLHADSKAVRQAAEKAIGESSLSWTILRPTMIFGTPDDRNIARLIRWIDRCPVVPVFGPGNFRMQPVFVKDLASAVARLLASDNGAGKAYNLSGADVIDYNGLVTLVAELLGKQARLLHLPLSLSLAATFISRALPGFPNLSKEQVLRLNEHKDFSHADAAADFGYSPTALRDALKHEVKLYRSAG